MNNRNAIQYIKVIGIRLRPLALGIVSIALVSCASPSGTSPSGISPSAKQGDKADVVAPIPKAELPLAVRFLPSCPASKKGRVETPGIIAAIGVSAVTAIAEKVIPAAVGYLYDQGVAWLDEQQLRLSASSTASGTNTFYDKNGLDKLGFGCIVLVRGNFSTELPTALRVPTSMQIDNSWAQYWNLGVVKDRFESLNLAGPPELYIELAIEPVASPVRKIGKSGQEKSVITQWKLSPVLVDYFGSGAKDNPTRKKNILVNIKIESVATPNAGTIFAREYDLGFLELGQRHHTEYLDGDIYTLPAHDVSKSGLVDVVPIKATAVITETEPGRDFARAIAKSLSDDEAKKKFVDDVAGQVVAKVKEVLVKQADTDTGIKK